MIVWAYPPLGGAGCIRYLNFSKFLPQFGWNPYILTVKNPSFLLSRDFSLKIPKDLKIYRSITLPSFNLAKVLGYFMGKFPGFFFIPDPHIGWIPDTIRKGLSIIRKEKIDLIFVGCSPHSATIIGYILKKITKKPLILDFRDPYAENPMTNYPSRIHKYLNKKIEQKVIQSANCAITVTPSFIKYFPYKEKFALIPNGYFDLTVDETESVEKYQKFTISTVGTLYSNKVWVNFFKALKIFQKKSNIKSLQVLFIGYKQKKLIKPITKKLNISHLVQYTGFVPNEECNYLLKKSHICVIILPPAKNSALVIKVFSYLHSDSPVLGIMAKSSETAKFIRKSNIGIVVENSIQGIVKGLMRLSKGEYFERNWEYIKLFDRKELTQKLAILFDKIHKKTR